MTSNLGAEDMQANTLGFTDNKIHDGETDIKRFFSPEFRNRLDAVLRFKALEKDFTNFKFYIALSEPMEEDNWKVKDSLDGEGDGLTGFVHQVVIDNYLSYHDAPEDIEVYFCGPPLMNQAIERMAEDYGVPPENVRFDDFGG